MLLGLRGILCSVESLSTSRSLFTNDLLYKLAFERESSEVTGHG